MAAYFVYTADSPMRCRGSIGTDRPATGHRTSGVPRLMAVGPHLNRRVHKPPSAATPLS